MTADGTPFMVMMECQDESLHAGDVVSLGKDFHQQVEGTGPTYTSGSQKARCFAKRQRDTTDANGTGEPLGHIACRSSACDVK